MDFRTGVEEIVHNIAVKAALDKLHPVIEVCDQAKEEYGRMFVMQAIGKPSNPFENGGDWKPLSQKWLDRKKATLDDPRFYSGTTGTLALAMETLAPEDTPNQALFGKTELIVRDWIWEANGFYNPRIKKHIDVVYRNERGQFARRSEFRKKPVQIRIRPFPGLPNYNAENILKQLPIDADQLKKLEVNDSLRPVIVPFTEWFYQNKIKMLIQSYVRNL